MVEVAAQQMTVMQSQLSQKEDTNIPLMKRTV
jgi:hypothetical protein